MTTPKILRILNKGVIVATIVSALSFVFPLIPCTKEKGISICQLPSPLKELPELASKYYSVSTNPLAGIVLQFLVVLFIFTIIFMSFRRKAGKVLDLTNKK